MDDSIIKFYLNVFNKYYYKEEKFLEAPILDYYKRKNQELLSLIKTEYDVNEIIKVVNLWIDYENEERKKKFSWAPIDLQMSQHISLNNDIITQFNKINNLILNPVFDLSYNEKLSYLYIDLGFSLFEQEQKRKVIYELPNVKMIYGSLIDDKDFVRWGLIPISDDRILEDGRIFDYKNNKTVLLNLDKEICSIFVELLNKNKINKLSIRSNDIVLNGIKKDESLQEAVEKGVIFNLSLQGIPNETKLYSTNYNDQMWVFKEGNDLTFEELCNNFVLSDDSIVTQMIHLQYIVEDGKCFITHIDKENIFYTLDEYNERCVKNIKGTAKRREKIFKIDNSRIEFDYPCSIINFKVLEQEQEECTIPFIYYVVKHFFNNSDLIDEYFNKII